MAVYRYSVISQSGERLTGVMDARDEFEAAERIKTSVGGFIQSIKKQGIDLNLELTPPKISEKELSLCCSQFAALLKSGLPLARTVESVGEQTGDKVLKKILLAVAQDIQSGIGLAESLERHGKTLPVVFLETIRAGELSGTLEASFADMEKYWRKSYKLKAKIKKALSYPAFLISVAVVVIMIIVNAVLPAFLPMFEGRELPLPTQMLMNGYNFVQTKGLFILAGLVAVVVLFVRYKRSPVGRGKLAHILMRAPVLGRVNTMNAAAQFSNTMASLLSAGLPLVKALEITAKVVSNLKASELLQDAAKNITEGKRLGESLQGSFYFPSLLLEMVSIGEEAGSLEESLGTIGNYYDEEADAAVTAAMGKLEPIITILMGIVVGFIMVSLYMPMFDLGGGII